MCSAPWAALHYVYVQKGTAPRADAEEEQGVGSWLRRYGRTLRNRTKTVVRLRRSARTSLARLPAVCLATAHFSAATIPAVASSARLGMRAPRSLTFGTFRQVLAGTASLALLLLARLPAVRAATKYACPTGWTLYANDGVRACAWA